MMISKDLSAIIESCLLVAISLPVLYVLAISYKHSKTIPGADLLFLGFLLYAAYPLVALAAVGFTESFFDNFNLVSVFHSDSYIYYVSYALRLGLILAIIGLFRIGRSLKA